ncbi:Glycoside hydrolase superfamily [Penicillium chermesinum]|uniref:Glycoside hydrolase superfamily n=1 Tax=Penicillium chermesinum TaxID=63820 RepID=A0A9W9NYD7_9EURO|nr:Glycoside hydrolase superfamily [Penicillium chermesinum]KAJ5232068.1 Glycoside hydrolase superfamily [Penicillium chermesinum]
MKLLTQVVTVFFFGVGALADLQEPKTCLREPNDPPQALKITEVVVWVNENGQPIRTETVHDAVTAKPKELVSSPRVRKTEDNRARIDFFKKLRVHTTVQTFEQSLATATASVIAEPQEPTTPEPHITVDRVQPKAHLKPDLHPHPHPHPHLHPQPHHPDPHPHHLKPHKSSRQFGVSYSPYNADRSCRSQEQVDKDLDQLSQYSYVRIYGTDCDQTKTVARAARKHNMQVFAGVYDLSDFPSSLDAFKAAALDPNGQEDWSVFHTIAIGNELVNGGHSTPGEVTGAVQQARNILRSQGYTGPVVTVDTFSVLLKHPELCTVSDYCAANCHAFFDATAQPHNAGPYVLEQAHSVSAAAGGKRTIITESGWPHAGQANGAAVPSAENQKIAVESLRRSFAQKGDGLVLFTAFDDKWKDDNRWTFNAERFWGMYTR